MLHLQYYAVKITVSSIKYGYPIIVPDFAHRANLTSGSLDPAFTNRTIRALYIFCLIKVSFKMDILQLITI